MTISEARKALTMGEITATELVGLCLKKIKEREPKLNSFISVNGENALQEAEKVDDTLKESGDKTKVFQKKPLLGIPVAVKDVLSTAGLQTTASSKILENYEPVYDASVVARIKEVGAIVIGKTNSDTFAFGASTENSGYGVTHNPWDLSRVAGGSSGGSAAAVAADEAVFALGTDTGGSIRLPASFCGVTGMKMTYGGGSRYGLLSMASSFDTPGSLTKTVADAREIYSLIKGFDKKDATSSRDVNHSNSKVKELKIGVPIEFFDRGLDRNVKDVVMDAIGVYEKLGASIKKVALPKTEYGVATYYVLVPAEISSNLARYDGIRFGKTRNFFEDEAKRRIMIGTYALSSGYYDAYYKKASQVRALIIKEFDQVFENVDVLMGPVCPTPAFKIGEKASDPLAMYLSDVYTVTVNLAGLSGISIPAGFSLGLPVGLQIIGPQGSDERILDVAEEYERETEWHKQKPKI